MPVVTVMTATFDYPSDTGWTYLAALVVLTAVVAQTTWHDDPDAMRAAAGAALLFVAVQSWGTVHRQGYFDEIGDQQSSYATIVGGALNAALIPTPLG
jgi:hypothetical protein